MSSIEKASKNLKKGNCNICMQKKTILTKRSCRMVPKVVIYLFFEGKKVEGSQKKTDGREFHRQDLERKKPPLNRLNLALERSTK